jgi:hypothetical protein
MRVAGVDLSAQLLVHSLRADHAAATCSACRRHLLPGEILHVYDQHKALCTLCAGRLPDDQREPVRSERVHAGERHLAVLPRAA